MKKIYSFIAIGLASFTISQAQNAVKNALPLSANGKEKANSKNLLPLKSIQNDGIAKAAPFWTDDFSVPAKWDISHAAGTSGDWVIGTAVPAGSFPLDPITSTTASNGYALFDSDLLCTNNQIADLTTADSVNCSTHSGVLLQFQQTYRRFDDSTFVYVSNNGTSWTKFTVNGLVANNNAQVNPENISLNISSVAGGQASVWIRFEFWSPSTYTTGPGGAPGCAYSWMIDDVQLVDAPNNDLVAMKALGYEYSFVPSYQGQNTNFGVITSNAGATLQANAKLNVKINKGTTNVFDQDGSPVNFGSGLTDTIFEATPYLANFPGQYSVVYNVTSDATDEVPADNSITQNFAVTDTVFGRDGGFNSSFNGTSQGVETGTTNSQAYKIGNWYDLKPFGGLVDAKSITFAVASTAAGLANTVGETVKVTLGLIDQTVTSSISILEVASSDDYVLKASDITNLDTATMVKYITLPFTSSYNLTDTVGEYIAYLEYLGNSGGKIVYIATSTPNLHVYKGSSWVYDNSPSSGTPGWFYYPETTTPILRLNLSGPVGIKEQDTKLGQSLYCYPNPTSGLTTISFETKETSDITIKVIDVTGKVVATVNQGRKVAGKQTANVDLSSLPTGMYAYNVTAGGYSATKTVLVK